MSHVKLLSEHEAAIKLGITPELLFEYTRFSPKTHLGHERKLTFTITGLQRGFLTDALEEWDNYLQQPWANKDDKRPSVPVYIQRYLKVECGGKCALCGTGHKLEDAHIMPYEESLSHYHHNLIRLCKDCHSKYDDGIIPRENIQSIKAKLVEKLRSDIKAKSDLFTSRIPSHIPQPNTFFLGREVELAELQKQLSKNRVVIIQGVGGIGKTQLLLQALSSEVETTSVPCIWLDLDNYRKLEDVELALHQSLAEFGLATDTTKTTLDLIHGIELRIILDGLDRLAVSNWDHVFDFITDLIRLTKQPQFVITTQVDLESIDFDAFTITLRPLESTTSRMYLTKATTSTSPKFLELNLKWLIEFCNGHPLTLKLVTGLLNHYKNANTVVSKLKKKGSYALRDPRRKTQKRSTALDVCLNSIHDCLTDFQKRLLQFVSCFPAGCMEGDFGVWSQADDYLDAVAELEQFFLIETRLDALGITRVHLHNPIWLFVRSYWKNSHYEEAAKIQLEAAESLMIYLAVVNEKYFENPESIDALRYGLYRVDLEIPNYIHALRFARWCVSECKARDKSADKYLQVIMGIALGLGQYFFLRDMYKLGEEFLQEGVNACKCLKEYEHGVLLCQYLLQLLGKQNDTEKETTVTKQLISFTEKSCDETVQARLAMSLGDLALTQRNFKDAFEHYSKAANYFREDANKHLLGEDVYDAIFRTGTHGLALVSLGRVCEEQRKSQKAIEFYNEALKYQLFIRDYTNLGATYHQLGNCFLDLQDYPVAITHYQHAVRYFSETQQGQHLSNALTELCEVAERTRDYIRISESLTLESGWFIFALNYVKHDLIPLLNEDTFAQPTNWRLARLLLRKLLNIIKLISFKKISVELLAWCNDFLQNVFRISVQEEEWIYKPLSYYHRSIFMAIILGIRIAKYQTATNISEEQLLEICDLCVGLDEQFDPDVPIHTSPHSFRWLEEWLRYWDLYEEDLTAEDLIGFFDEILFNISGFIDYDDNEEEAL